MGQEAGERAGGEESFWAAGKKNWDAGWAGTKKENGPQEGFLGRGERVKEKPFSFF